jgi:RNA polymerase sigma-70 factor (ECF subfamily)
VTPRLQLARADVGPDAADAAATDARLLEKLKAGDQKALDEVLALLWSPVVSYVASLLGSREAAEDVAQETFFRLWERRAVLRPDGSLRGFVYQVARNLAISERRKGRVQERTALAMLDELEPVAVIEIADRAMSRQLVRAVNELPERRREVLLLHAVHGLTHREIGRLLGIAPQTVANQFSAALQTLRKALPLATIV